MGAVGSGRVPTAYAGDEGPTSQVVGGHGGLDGRGRAVEEAHIPMIPQEAVDGLLEGSGGAGGSGGERDGGGRERENR